MLNPSGFMKATANMQTLLSQMGITLAALSVGAEGKAVISFQESPLTNNQCHCTQPAALYRASH